MLIDFLEKKKRLEIGGKEIIIIRAGIGLYYRLISLLLRDIETVKSIETAADFESMVSILATQRCYKRELIDILAEFVSDEEAARLYYNDVLKAVLEWNSIGGKGGELTFKNLNKTFDIIVSKIAAMTGWNINYILLRVNNIQAHKLIEAWDNEELKHIGYIRMATQADNKEWRRFIGKCKGWLVGDDEIMNFEDGANGRA